MSKFTDEPITERELLEYLSNSSDFAIDLRTLERLNYYGFDCSHGGPYSDPITGKIRQFDIRASRSLAGKDGHGYRLAMEPEQISLLDIVEVVDNVLADAGALEVGGFNPHAVELVERALADVTSKTRKHLASLTLSSLRAAKAA